MEQVSSASLHSVLISTGLLGGEALEAMNHAFCASSKRPRVSCNLLQRLLQADGVIFDHVLDTVPNGWTGILDCPGARQRA